MTPWFLKRLLGPDRLCLPLSPKKSKRSPDFSACPTKRRQWLLIAPRLLAASQFPNILVSSQLAHQYPVHPFLVFGHAPTAESLSFPFFLSRSVFLFSFRPPSVSLVPNLAATLSAFPSSSVVTPLPRFGRIRIVGWDPSATMTTQPRFQRCKSHSRRSFTESSLWGYFHSSRLALKLGPFFNEPQWSSGQWSTLRVIFQVIRMRYLH